MKPATFAYQAPQDIAQALTALAAAGAGGRLLAGGQTLGPMLNLRLARPSTLIDLGRIDELKRIARNGNRIAIGAGVTHARLEDQDDPSPTGRFLAHVAGGIAYRAIRNCGTIGGSLAHADPAADWVTAMSLLEATLSIAGPAGRRALPMSGFMHGAFATGIGPGEILAGIEFEAMSPEARWGYYRICRKVGEFPEAVGAALFDRPRGLACVVAGALDGAPVVLTDLADRIARQGAGAASAEAVQAALRAAAPGLDPVDLQCHAAAVRRAIVRAIGP